MPILWSTRPSAGKAMKVGSGAIPLKKSVFEWKAAVLLQRSLASAIRSWKRDYVRVVKRACSGPGLKQVGAR